MAIQISSETSKAIFVLLDTIEAEIKQFRTLLKPIDDEADPRDPRNKTADGKLTERGVEVCYRLFDQKKTRYAVCQALQISFGAATHRLDAYHKAGGPNRKKTINEN